MEITSDLIIRTLLLVFQLALVIIFTRRSKIKVKADKKLKKAFLLGAFAAFISIFVAVIPQYSAELKAIQWFFYTLQSFTFYLFFEDLSNATANLKRLIAFTSVSTLSIMGSVVEILGSTSSWTEFIWQVSYSLIGLMVFAFGFYTLLSVYKITRENSALLQVIGTVFMMIGFFIGTLITPMIKNILRSDLISFTVADIFKIIGIILFVILYVINPRYILRLPVQVRSIIVYTRNGINLIRFDTNTLGIPDNQYKISNELITALATAVTGFAKEAMGSSADLDLLMTKDSVIRFKINDISLALICNRETQVLVDSLEYYSVLLNEEFKGHDFQVFNPNGSEIQNMIKMLNIAFPYLVVQSHTK